MLGSRTGASTCASSRLRGAPRPRRGSQDGYPAPRSHACSATVIAHRHLEVGACSTPWRVRRYLRSDATSVPGSCGHPPVVDGRAAMHERQGASIVISFIGLGAERATRNRAWPARRSDDISPRGTPASTTATVDRRTAKTCVCNHAVLAARRSGRCPPRSTAHSRVLLPGLAAAARLPRTAESSRAERPRASSRPHLERGLRQLAVDPPVVRLGRKRHGARRRERGPGNL